MASPDRRSPHEPFESTEARFVAAYEGGVERLAGAVEAAAQGKEGWDVRVSAGLRAGLEFLAADPPLARLLLVEALAAARPARLEHERSLERLARALRPPSDVPGGETVPEETLRLLAGGLASRLSGRVLADEVEQLPGDHDLLLSFLLAPTHTAGAQVAVD